MRWFLPAILLGVVSRAAVMVYPTSEGNTVRLDLGDYIVTWGRIRDGSKVKEFIKRCTDGAVKSRECEHWIDENGKEVKTGSKSHVATNGTLVITNFNKADAGSYFSNDERARVTQTAEGYVATPKSMINVVIES